MSRNVLAKIFLMKWQVNLKPNRLICTSTTLNERRRRDVSKRLDIYENEMGIFEDEINDPTPEELTQYASEISRDSSRFQTFVQQKTIGQKYFKQYEPKEENFLTWEMKEQLKYLHHLDPAEWTPEALSVVFPVSPSGAQKLLNSKWVPETEKEIERHDRAVIARWKKYTNGQLGSAKLLEEILRQRLYQKKESLPAPIMDSAEMMQMLESLDFQNEEKPNDPDPQYNRLPKKKIRKMRSGSFVSIIENYESQKLRKEENPMDQPFENKEKSDRYVNADVITAGTPVYRGSSSRVSSNNFQGRNLDKKMGLRESRKVMTLDEFLQQKSKS